MKRFFMNISFQSPFLCFTKLHTICIIITALLLLILLSNSRKLLMLNNNKKKFICYIMAIIVSLNLIIYRGSYLLLGNYDWHKHLDLYLCFIINWLLVFCWIFQNKKLYQYVYYFAFTGPLISIIFPDLKTGTDTFIFYSFFISYNLLFIFNIMTCVIWNVKFDIKKVLYSFVFLVSIVLLTYLFNFALHTSYNSFAGLIDSNGFYYVLMKLGFVNIIGNEYFLMSIIGIMGYCLALLLLKIINCRRYKL